MKRIKKFFMFILAAAYLYSCKGERTADLTADPPAAQEEAYGSEETEASDKTPEERLLEIAEATDSIVTGLTKEAEEAMGRVPGEADISRDTPGSAPYAFLPETMPEYDGSPAAVINGGVPFFSKEDLTTEAFESYSPLDSLGRCGTAYANVCRELMPDKERGEIGMIKPSGWHTAKYMGCVEGNYLYNRCHLIAYQLAGENANERNLITGTRYLNVIGMLPYEDMVADYVHRNPGNHVLYRVTPIFKGENKVASGVLMEAYSVEDSGKGVCFNVFCHNIQPGIIIDYGNGESCLDENFNGEYVTESVFTEKGGKQE